MARPQPSLPSARINTLLSRIRTWFIDLSTSPTRIYGLLTSFSLLISLLIFGGLRLQEQTLIAAVRDQPTYENYGDLYAFYLDHRWYRSGRHTFAQLAASFPDDADPLIRLARLERIAALHTNTLPDLTQAEAALVRTGGDSQSFADLAGLFLYAERPAEARLAAERALSLAPTDLRTLWTYGQAVKRDGDVRTAETTFTRCANDSNLTSIPFGNYYRQLCAAEVFPATRALTLTLQPDRFAYASYAHFTEPFQTLTETVRRENPNLALARMGWGTSTLRDILFSNAFFLTYPATRIDESNITIARSDISYHWLWDEVPDVANNPHITLADFPLSAYTNPTTITLVLDDVSLRQASLPFQHISDNTIIWRLDQQAAVGSPLTIQLFSSTWSIPLITLATTGTLYWGAYIVLYMVITLWALFALARARQRSIPMSANAPWLSRALHPRAPWLWLFDLIVFGLASLTIVLPLLRWLLEGSLATDANGFAAVVWILGLLLVRLAIGTLNGVEDTLRLGGDIGLLIFVCFLIPRITFVGNIYGFFFLLPSLLAGYLLLVRNRERMARYDSAKLPLLYGPQRGELLHTIRRLERGDELVAAQGELEQALAKGILKAPEYRESRALITQMEAEHAADIRKIYDDLGLADDETPGMLPYRLGPAATALGNGLYAAAFGSLPFLLFIGLAFTQGDVQQNSISSWLFTTVGVPWGPIYLFFFGYIYRLISGDFGILKGLTFALVLCVACLAATLFSQYTPPDWSNTWGEMLRLLVTFTLTGALMDWAASDFSWPTIRRSYNSRAVTTVVAIIGTVVTTVLTGVLTGTLSQMLSLAIQSSATALGVPGITPAPGP